MRLFLFHFVSLVFVLSSSSLLAETPQAIVTRKILTEALQESYDFLPGVAAAKIENLNTKKLNTKMFAGRTATLDMVIGLTDQGESVVVDQREVEFDEFIEGNFNYFSGNVVFDSLDGAIELPFQLLLIQDSKLAQEEVTKETDSVAELAQRFPDITSNIDNDGLELVLHNLRVLTLEEKWLLSDKSDESFEARVLFVIDAASLPTPVSLVAGADCGNFGKDIDGRTARNDDRSIEHAAAKAKLIGLGEWDGALDLRNDEVVLVQNGKLVNQNPDERDILPHALSEYSAQCRHYHTGAVLELHAFSIDDLKKFMDVESLRSISMPRSPAEIADRIDFSNPTGTVTTADEMLWIIEPGELELDFLIEEERPEEIEPRF